MSEAFWEGPEDSVEIDALERRKEDKEQEEEPFGTLGAQEEDTRISSTKYSVKLVHSQISVNSDRDANSLEEEGYSFEDTDVEELVSLEDSELGELSLEDISPEPARFK